MTRFHSTGHFRSRTGLIARGVLTRWRQEIRGSAAIEFGFIVPVLALMLISAVDIGLGIYHRMQVASAAQAGIEYAMRNGFDVNAINSAVTSAANTTAISPSPPPFQFCGCATAAGVVVMSCSAACPSGSTPATYTTVSAQGIFSTLLNYPTIPDSYKVNAQSTARLQ